MKLIDIIAEKEQLVFTLDEPFTGTFTLTEEAPIIHGEQVIRAKETLQFTDGKAAAARHAGEHDRIFGRFLLTAAGAPVPGVCYVTGFGESCDTVNDPYPQPDTIKTLNTCHEIAAPLGAKQTRPDVNLPMVIALHEHPDTIPYRFEGRTYYIFKSALATIERTIAGFELSSLIVLNSPRVFGCQPDQEDLLQVCIHPHYQDKDPAAFISAFNMTSVEGQQVFAAFISFLAMRYACQQGKYGTVGGIVISNEINLQYNWSNAGETPVEDYMEEYTQAMRIAWLAAAGQYRNFRIYSSLANNWNMTHENPLLFYHGRECIDLLGSNSVRDGNFPWHVAFHPYPESFDHPDFWNDRAAEFRFDTPRITYRNMEVLEAYLAQPQLLYKGQPRRIIFSEQGFNSGDGPLRELHEKWAAAGYVLSYMKARNMKTVDMMTHHSTIDNPHEFGLNLGVYRYDANAPFNKGEAKPIAWALQLMDTPAEVLAIQFAREVIGDTLFDYILNPPAIAAGRDGSLDTEFGSGKDNA